MIRADDETTVHKRRINRLAELGITAGCDADLKRCASDQPIMRARRVTLLVCASGEEGVRGSGSSRFSGVVPGAWYFFRLGDPHS